MSSGERVSYDTAQRVAVAWVTHIAMLDTTEKVAVVGSLRRKEEEIGDIDIQVQGSPNDIDQLFWRKGVAQLSGGEKRQIYKFKSGIKINIFYAKPTEWGSSLMHNTGPRRYNIRKRAQVKRIGYKLNQEGIWADDGYKVISVETNKIYHCDTEQKVYDFFGWDYCKPEDRK
tara:strand:+ start:261 stop:776 length:516 start_codon:yes stop_codon:yes gene_type:complete